MTKGSGKAMKLRLFQGENKLEAVMFCWGDAWLITDFGMFSYVCRERTLLSPERWTPAYKPVPYSELNDGLRRAVDTVLDTEYYQPGPGEVVGI